MATFLIGAYIARVMIFSNQPLFLTCWRRTMFLSCAHCVSKFQKTKSTCNLKAIDHEAFKEEMESFVSQLPPLTQLTEFLKSLLDKYAPVTWKNVQSHRCSLWFASVSEQLLDLKHQRCRAKRRWRKSGLTVDRQIFSMETEATNYQAHASGKDGVLQHQNLC